MTTSCLSPVCLQCCQILVVNGVDLGIKDQDGFTAAELAEYNGHSQCAKYLRTVENMVLFDAALTKDQTFTVWFFLTKGDQNT